MTIKFILFITEPFKANTIVIDEVTTAIIDFDYQQLVQLEQRWFFSCDYCRLI